MGMAIVTAAGEAVDSDVVNPFGGEIDPKRFRRLLIAYLYAQGWSIDDLQWLCGRSRRTIYYELERIGPEVGKRVLTLI